MTGYGNAKAVVVARIEKPIRCNGYKANSMLSGLCRSIRIGQAPVYAAKKLIEIGNQIRRAWPRVLG
jgi:hypothetical protein